MTARLLAQDLIQRPHAPLQLDQPLEPEAIPTPALLLDRRLLSSNLQRMQNWLTSHGKAMRPHGKTHKCPEIARQQLAAGAIGICVAKLSEAVVMANAGVGPILITSPLTMPDKVQVLNDLLLQECDIALVVDSEWGLAELRAGLSDDARLDVIIDLDVSMGRTGNRDVDQVARLIDGIAETGNLTFKGFQHYAGHVMHKAPWQERRDASLELWQEIEQRISALGVGYEVVTGAGTGTFDIDTEVSSLTDLQVGSFIFMDEEYRQIGSQSGDRFEEFDVSLFVAVSAISNPQASTITMDGGFKSMASDTVPPVCDDLADSKYRFAGDEHGVLIGETAVQSVRLGDVVKLVAPHCDPTVNLHDFFWVIEEDGLVHSRWPITGRGCTW